MCHRTYKSHAEQTLVHEKAQEVCSGGSGLVPERSGLVPEGSRVVPGRCGLVPEGSWLVPEGAGKEVVEIPLVPLDQDAGLAGQ